MAELAEQRLKAFEEEFGLIRTRGKGQGMHIPKTKAEKASGQLLSHACLCLALPEGGSHSRCRPKKCPLSSKHNSPKPLRATGLLCIPQALATSAPCTRLRFIACKSFCLAEQMRG